MGPFPTFLLAILCALLLPSGIYSKHYLPYAYEYADYKSSFWKQNLFYLYKSVHNRPSDRNLCNSNKKVNLFLNKTVQLHAANTKGSCAFNVYPYATSTCLFTISILRRAQSNSSNSYVELISEGNIKSTKVALPSINCTIVLYARSLHFTLTFMEIDFTIHALENDTNLERPQQNCDVKEYRNVVFSGDPVDRKWPFLKHTTTNNKYLRPPLVVSVYQNVHCPKNCKCTLDHNLWLTNCQKDYYQILLVCYPKMAGLSLTGKRLNSITLSAFWCYDKLQKLILNRNQIQLVPYGVFHGLDNLRYLDLGYNQLLSLPQGVFDKQSKLRYLILKNNYLSVLPDGIFKYNSNLKLLKLNRNNIVSLPTGVLNSLTELVDLHLHYNQLENISNVNFNHCKNMKLIKVSNNQLLKLSTFNLQTLQVLQLQHNNLNSIGRDVFNSPSLDFLDLSHNKLVNLSMFVFRNLTQLTNLFLFDNRLTELSNWWSISYSLMFLYMNNNFFGTLSGGMFDGFVTLQELSLQNNSIAVIAEETFRYTLDLKKLDLSINRITYLQLHVFRNLTQLVVLILDFNHIAFLDDNIFSELSNLFILNMYYNSLISLSDKVFNSTSGLEQLHLQHNMIADLPPFTFRRLNKLVNLYLSYNRIKHLHDGVFHGLVKLFLLDISYNELMSISENVFNSQPRLEHLFLSSNALFDVPYGLFDQLLKLRVLDLSFNYIVNVPAVNLSRLFQLDLIRNELDTLMASSFSHLTSLAAISLGHNRLTEMPKNLFTNLVNLRSLDLSFNYLTELPELIFSSNAHLQHLTIAGNVMSKCPNASHLTKLELFVADSNKFIDFPGFSFGSTELSLLWINRNELSRLPYFINRNVKLNHIELISNKIRNLDNSAFVNLTSLVLLALSENKLLEIQNELFQTLHNLQELYLDHNNILTLGIDVFSNLAYLKILHLHNNEITSLSDGLFNFNSRLQALTLSENRLSVLPERIFETLGQLEVLEMFGNNLQEINSDLLNFNLRLNFVTISANRISNLSENLFLVITKVNTLRICCNDISMLPMDIFIRLVLLESLSLANNKLTKLPDLRICLKLVLLELQNNRLFHTSFENIRGLLNLRMLVLKNNDIEVVPSNALMDLQALRVLLLSSNKIKRIEMQSFNQLHSLTSLDISDNSISNIESGSFSSLKELVFIDLHNNKLRRFAGGMLPNSLHLKLVNLSQNNIQNVAFTDSPLSNLTCDLRENPLLFLKPRSFNLSDNVTFLVNEYSVCCFTDNGNACLPSRARPSYLTCKRMLQSVVLRLTMWLVGVAALVFNAGVLVSRLLMQIGNKVQNVLIFNLALADFLMGLNMLVLTSADMYYADFFPSFSGSWSNGLLCKTASALSTISSEASVGLVFLVALDRYLGIRYPLGIHRGLGKTRMKICVFIIWMMAVFVSVAPLVIDLYDPGFYEISEVCVGLPIVKRSVTFVKNDIMQITTHKYNLEYNENIREGDISFDYINDTNDFSFRWLLTPSAVVQDIPYKVADVSGSVLASYVSITVFIGLNLICFLAIAILYIEIFQIATASSKQVQSTAKSKEMKMAIKMSAVVLTDFLCWVPLAFVCLLVQCGALTAGPEMYAWTVGFILPINSSLNPFLYTLASILADRMN